MRKILKIVGAVAGFLALLVLLGIGWLIHDGHRTRGPTADYVALGSSFAAGPGVAERAPDSVLLCGQSDANFAHLLARKRNLHLLDRSCGGSTTAHVLRDSQFFQTPQIEAVQATTRLVTVTTGGNDLGYLGGLWMASCRHRPDVVPGWLKGACKQKPADPIDTKLRSLAASMDTLAREVRRRAPRATLAFVDYTTVLPEGRGCPDRLPLSDEELAHARLLAAGLARVTMQVARDNKAVLVRASDLSRGHDLCAADPWVFGWEFPSGILGFGPYAYHPTAKAMTAIAAALDRQLPPRL